MKPPAPPRAALNQPRVDPETPRERRRSDRTRSAEHGLADASAPATSQAALARELADAQAAFAAGHWLHCLRLARRGEEAARHAGDRSLRVEFLLLAGDAHLRLDDLPSAVERFETARDETDTAPASIAHIRALLGLGASFGAQGQRDAALAHLDRAHGLAAKVGHAPLMAGALNNRAAVLASVGQGVAALAELDRAERLMLGTPDPRWEPQLAHTRGEVFMRMRRWLHATRAFRRALAAPAIDAHPPLLIRTHIDLATALAESGHWSPVLDLALGALHEAQVRHLHPFAAEAALLASRAAIVARDLRAAEQALEALRHAQENSRNLLREGRKAAAQWALELRELRERARRDEARLMSLAAEVVEQQSATRERDRALQLDTRSGLLTRSAFEDALSALIRSAPDEPFCILMIDTGDIAALARAQGRAVADTARQTLIASARRVVRERDLLTDFGTGELIVCCHGVGDVRAARIADAVRDGFADEIRLRLPHLPFDPLRIAVIYTRGRVGMPLLSLLHRLDRALARVRQAPGETVVTIRALAHDGD